MSGIDGSGWVDMSKSAALVDGIDDIRADMGLLRDELGAALAIIRTQGKAIEELTKIMLLLTRSDRDQDRLILMASEIINSMSKEITALKRQR